jgi:hypothetical protein
MKRALLAVLLGLIAAGACSTAAAPRPGPECHLFQFRACKDPCGRGSQHCLPSGTWSPCSCVVDDASYAGDGAAPDADSGAEDSGTDAALPDGGDAGDVEGIADADAATDAGLLD